jgi:hypothetical protein
MPPRHLCHSYLLQGADAWTVKAEKTIKINIPVKLFHECYPAIVSMPAAQTFKTRVCGMVLKGKVYMVDLHAYTPKYHIATAHADDPHWSS